MFAEVSQITPVAMHSASPESADAWRPNCSKHPWPQTDGRGHSDPGAVGLRRPGRLSLMNERYA